jgi:hypothetical protein
LYTSTSTRADRVVFEVTFTVNVALVPRAIALGLTVAVPVHGAAGTVVVVVGGTVVVVVGGSVVVVVVVVVGATAAFTVNDAAEAFHNSTDVHPGAKIPTLTE